MFLYKTNSGWTARVPAKLNLFFEVHGKRQDGYHEISSLALPIRLFDTLTFETTPGDEIDFDCVEDCVGGSPDVPRGADNIVVRALELLKRKTGMNRGAKVRLFKRIPSRAGLGGGSGDAAAALALARAAWDPALSMETLAGWASEIGSDCPIFFHRGASLSRGRGERIEPIGPIPPLWFVLLKPEKGLSTTDVYAECMKCHDGCFRNFEDVLMPLRNGTIAQAGRCFFNRLESAAETIWPQFESVRRRLERLDCLAVRMSGSGTAFYGLCRNARHAKFVAEQLRHRTGDSERIFWTSSGF